MTCRIDLPKAKDHPATIRSPRPSYLPADDCLPGSLISSSPRTPLATPVNRSPTTSPTDPSMRHSTLMPEEKQTYLIALPPCLFPPLPQVLGPLHQPPRFLLRRRIRRFALLSLSQVQLRVVCLPDMPRQQAVHSVHVRGEGRLEGLVRDLGVEFEGELDSGCQLVGIEHRTEIRVVKGTGEKYQGGI